MAKYASRLIIRFRSLMLATAFTESRSFSGGMHIASILSHAVVQILFEGGASCRAIELD